MCGARSVSARAQDLAAEPQQGVLQRSVRRLGEAGGQLALGGGVQRRAGAALRRCGGRGRRLAERTLNDAQLRHRPWPEIQVQPVEDQRRLVLHQGGDRTSHPQLQRRPARARLDQLDRLGASSQRLADDLLPARLQVVRSAAELLLQFAHRRGQAPRGVARRAGRGPRPARSENGEGFLRRGQRAAHRGSIDQLMLPVVTLSRLRKELLAWYDAHARDLPWRVRPAERARGRRADPYRVWLSEIMLQQTTVPHATPYFLAFTRRWPTVSALAAADDGEVMAAWAGLGYYARARNLIACARVVAERLGGVFPDNEEGLRALPGVGPYTRS